MKQIKYRAWHIKDRVMFNVMEIHFVPEGILVFGPGAYNNLLVGKDVILMQYIGLNSSDKNEYIYEDDVVEMVIEENIGTYNVPDDVIANGGVIGCDIFRGRVIFNDGFFSIDDEENGICGLGADSPDVKLHILGNIHENELKNQK